MSKQKMHPGELDIDPALVQRLLSAQFPAWAGLPIRTVPSAGTDNALFRLGENRLVRLPRIHWAAGQIEKEQRWLPKLAPHLPLAIPVPLAKGEPGQGYPWHWSVYRWIDGEEAVVERLCDPHQAAADLAGFIRALQQIDPSGGPPPDMYNSFRGAPLAARDSETRAAIASLRGMLDADAATAVWDAALQAPACTEPPVWIHGDLQPGNLLSQHGRLSAVIDFGCSGVGDPACDLMIAWKFLPAHTRDTFRTILQVDDAAWMRGRGWALSTALIALPYYLHTNPVLAGSSRRAIEEVLGDLDMGGFTAA